ncbi:MAG: (d)CMP kinase [Candidatus Nanoarchaeia archaeon]|nr:(d)CMP kinase [Candidatus Nanoarchaeia archaeon]
MRICIGGDIGSGKSSVAKEIAKKLNYECYLGSKIYRDYVIKHDMTMLEIVNYPEIISKIDKEIDEYQESLNKKDNFVIDSRLGYFFIKNSIKIYLKTSFNVATNRIFNANRESEKYSNINELKNEIINRTKEESQRFLSLYKTDPHNLKNFDIIIDTNEINIDETVKKILEQIKQ